MISPLPFPEPSDSVPSPKMTVYFPSELLFCHLMQNVSGFIIFLLRGRTKQDVVITLTRDHTMLSKTDIYSVLLIFV